MTAVLVLQPSSDHFVLIDSLFGFDRETATTVREFHTLNCSIEYK